MVVAEGEDILGRFKEVDTQSPMFSIMLEDEALFFFR